MNMPAPTLQRGLCSFFTDDSRVLPHNSRISLAFTLLLLLVGLVSLFTIFNNLNAPYLCKNDGIVLHCPYVKESPSLWENPFSSTTSWKPCAERQDGVLPGVIPSLFYSEENSGSRLPSAQSYCRVTGNSLAKGE
ncbi:hypothetical protein AAZX31_15G171300 [Glycine max]|uniref:Uncharacterized protein n=2 Tax=Glycine subgen. Soja TaxID=1462606 RepID=K7MC57_SOYBN|nr:protein PECTIC ARABINOGALACTAN SYNTHESIS-RELATED-like isoform X1 [Glycine soja]XP_040866072.1 protein PECTIC ARABINOGALACTAN SYNTHESIS-RELATED [Glycine max]KAH1147739.1 hypothetical protein GYH30_042739 [Glycine max]KRH12578.1 hypothetical protein GLYMA_15G180200v4 [Glycine max]RZB65140.1 Protein PECTIC ARABINOGALACTAN SYNTHESIS-RELATED isoform A [Glycine soja]RZB65141.1 Protein PECTIC ARABINOGALACTAN SYNTHESIS-RELATED isoform B [Glycine soja]|eukprot:XP_025981460.1 protein PECTIC ARABINOGALACTAN SYNTHESIS-RELATED isoform X1 [Glycine max]